MEEETPNILQDKRKRRSSIFQRKSILLSTTDNTSQELDESNMKDKSPSPMIEEDTKVNTEIEKPFDLQEYIENLKHEKQIWHEVLQERRAQSRNLAKKKAVFEKTGQEVDLSLLTEYERNFIETRPNYEHIIKNSEALVDMAVKVAVLNQHCNRLYSNFNSRMEEKIKDATNKIISLVD